MQVVSNGQCGLCTHFAEGNTTPQIVQLRTRREAPEDLVDRCGHPKHAPLHLKVTAISSCDGFEPAAINM